jgi:outer membrane protein OmpA-like peptidoglycan-associated protein
MITFLGPEKPVMFRYDSIPLAWQEVPVSELLLAPKVEIKNIEIAIVRGVIRDTVTLKPVGGVPVEIYDNNLGRTIESFESNGETGEYMVSLPSGHNYGFAVKAKDYLFCSENLAIPASTTVREITKDFYLKKIEVGSKIILKNIFFDFNKATLRPESEAELDRLVKLLQDMSSLKIELSGHTDNVGSALYNQKLSENRAKTVVEYLINYGIDKDRLSYKGYGFSQPIASNDTEEGRQLNRRTEFKVLSK